MPTVHNKRHKGIPTDAVYIGRPSKWGNPFSHLDGTLAQFRVASRDEAVAKYREWLLQNTDLLAQAKLELVGRDLVCWCKPAACHGDVLIEVANDRPADGSEAI